MLHLWKVNFGSQDLWQVGANGQHDCLYKGHKHCGDHCIVLVSFSKLSLPDLYDEACSILTFATRVVLSKGKDPIPEVQCVQSCCPSEYFESSPLIQNGIHCPKGRNHLHNIVVGVFNVGIGKFEMKISLFGRTASY